MVVVAPERDMEAVEEEVAAPPAVAKGKRTKRQRLLSPIPITIVPPPQYTGETASAPPPPFHAASSEESTTTEEENTAWCLVLLSQGHFQNNDVRSRRYDEAATTSYGDATKAPRSGGGGVCMYACKTCNRSFSSFQALGGHRASHRKPKNEKRPAMFSDDEDFPSPSYLQLSSVSTSPYSATMKSSPSPRMHVCSYCGAEFTSGQALGGHMRKHRGAGPINRSFEPEELKEPGNGLSLDLNLRVPEPEEEREKSPKEANQRFCLPLLLHH